MSFLNWLLNVWARLMSDARRQEELKKLALRQELLMRNLLIETQNLQDKITSRSSAHDACLTELKELVFEAETFNRFVTERMEEERNRMFQKH